MSKVAIVYASRHGTTEKVACLLAEKLKNEVKLISLKEDKDPDINPYDLVILGTSVYAGNPLKTITKFCEENKTILLQKNIGLFVCGMEPNPEKQAVETENAYPEYLREHAYATEFLGGEFIFEKLNIFEKLIIKKVSKVTSSVSAIHNDAIEKFIYSSTAICKDNK